MLQYFNIKDIQRLFYMSLQNKQYIWFILFSLFIGVIIIFKNSVIITNRILLKDGIIGQTQLIIKHKNYPNLKLGDNKTYPKIGDICHVHYIAKLINGKTIDSTYTRNQPLVVSIGKHTTIVAIEEGVVKMSLNQKALIIAPYNVAFGTDGYGTMIPPFSTILFEVTLIHIFNRNHVTSRLT